MQIINQTLSLSCRSIESLEYFTRYSRDSFCIFDIETTGLSPKVSSVYLIGALWYDSDAKQFCSRQWFADDYTSEKAILSDFHSFLQDFSILVHYNGSGFDLPYIEKKSMELGLISPFDTIQNLDIYREIRSLKPILNIPNLKLFTVEKLTGFMRKDNLSGKDCITVYSRYMQNKFFRNPEQQTDLQKLLLHNQEDLVGTLYSAQLLDYKNHFLPDTKTEYEFRLVKEDTLEICCPVPVSFSFPLHWEEYPFSIFWQDKQIQTHIALFHGTLFHFFPDYKQYYYLPAEDTAIHKSVGTYVAKEYREPAKRSNCYTKKEGVFLPVPSGPDSDSISFPLFRKTYKDKQVYVLWNEKTITSSLIKQILGTLIQNL